jgi:hypothetical protein
MGIELHLNGEEVSPTLFTKLYKAYHAKTRGVIKSITFKPEGKFDIVINHDVAKKEGVYTPPNIGEVRLHSLLNHDITMEPKRSAEYNSTRK